MTYSWSYLWFIGFESLIKNTTFNYTLFSTGKYNLAYNNMLYDEVFHCGDNHAQLTLKTASHSNS